MFSVALLSLLLVWLAYKLGYFYRDEGNNTRRFIIIDSRFFYIKYMNVLCMLCGITHIVNIGRF